MEGEEEKARVREVVDDEQQGKRKTVDHVGEDGQHYSTITHTCFVVSFFENTSLAFKKNLPCDFENILRNLIVKSGQQRKKENGRSINPCLNETALCPFSISYLRIFTVGSTNCNDKKPEKLIGNNTSYSFSDFSLE